MDWSTINLDALKRFPIYKMPHTYRLQEGSGNGCAGDAPGFPRYFTSDVYTSHGNTRRDMPQLVISYEDVEYILIGKDDSWEEVRMDGLFKRLWKPLPLNHERVRLWVRATYKHHQHCYNGFQNSMVISSSPGAGTVNMPENHNAVRVIRKFYPEHQPDLDLIVNPPKRNEGDWWETEAVRPETEAQCRGSQRGGVHHRHEYGWCQWCGWHKEMDSLRAIAGLDISTPMCIVADRLEDLGLPEASLARELIY